MENPEKKPAKSYSFETAKVMSVAFEMGFIIALPIVVLGLGGKWLDQKHHTHIFVYLAIAVALATSVIWLYSRLSELVQKLNQAAEHKEKKQTDKEQKKIK